MESFLDRLFRIVLGSAHAAVFEIGAIMAWLMLAFGLLEFHRGVRLRAFVTRHRLDRPFLTTLLALIPVDGSLLFQYGLYRKKGLRTGSLLAGMLGIGEEATYLVLSRNPLHWLAIAAVKLVTGTAAGAAVNAAVGPEKQDAWLRQDAAASGEERDRIADEHFHELPDKYRHKLHRFRYHRLGLLFWAIFGFVLVLWLLLQALHLLAGFHADQFQALGVPLVDWAAMLLMLVVMAYALVTSMTTREFGRIFEDEFEDTGDAAGDIAETCASVILLVFLMTVAVELVTWAVGMDRIGDFFSKRSILAVVLGALVGLLPGTGASLAFTTLWYALSGTPGALPFSALLACSMALVGDSQWVGMKQIRISQRRLHAISFLIALGVGGSLHLLAGI